MADTLANDIFICNFGNENVLISIKKLLNFVPEGPINNEPSLIQVMAWHRKGDKQTPESMMPQFDDALPGLNELNICVYPTLA